MREHIIQLLFLASTFPHTLIILFMIEHPRVLVQRQSTKSQFSYVVRAVRQRDVDLVSTQRDTNGYSIGIRKKEKKRKTPPWNDKCTTVKNEEKEILLYSISIPL